MDNYLKKQNNIKGIIFAYIIIDLLILTSPAFAQKYHKGVAICSDCHTMHHSEDGDVPNLPGQWKWSNEAKTYLLVNSINDTCLICHDGPDCTGEDDAPPDIVGNLNGGSFYIRAAGQLEEVNSLSGNPNGHDLGGEPGFIPGSKDSSQKMQIACSSCHNPHGSNNYRNLVANPGNNNDIQPVTGVKEDVASPTSKQYDVRNIHYLNSSNGLSQWCKGCHPLFHENVCGIGACDNGDTPDDGDEWIRHPIGGVTMSEGVSNGHLDDKYWFSTIKSRVPVVSPSNNIPNNDNEVFCGSCHKAHGSGHKYGLIYDNPATETPEDGERLLQTCQQCHYK
ncbi:MAG: cytochrome c3 family protein [bacterium]